MAKGTLTRPAYVDRLETALREGVSGSQVAAEQVRRNRYRFVVVSSRFSKQGHPERQRSVWAIADSTLNKSDLLKVAMIITLAPSEV